MMTTARDELLDDMVEATAPAGQCSIVVRDGSELAVRLRADGWVARSGWRTSTGDWLLRFETEGASLEDNAALPTTDN